MNDDITKAFATLAALLLAGGAGVAMAAAETAARVENPRPEGDLTTLRLTERAVERLGIVSAPVQWSEAPRIRRVGGIVMTPPGRTLQVAAPNEGTVLAVDGHDLPYPGTTVRRGQTLLHLLVVSAAELAQTREIIQVASARVALAEAEVRESPGSEAAARELDSARAALVAAEQRMRLMSGGGGRRGAGLDPVTVRSPVDGVVRALAVSAGQSVPAGAALLEIVKIDPVWVRTPIFSGDLDSIESGRAASVRRLSARDSSARVATPVTGPPSADSTAASVDLYFSVENAGGELRAGERVEVSLVLGDSGPAVRLPYAAVLYDIHGAAWVYERMDATSFVRRRVEIRYVEDGVAVLESGPSAGTPIVIDGAVELFGTEFGTGK